MDLREKIARELAAADGKDPDAPAWVQFPRGETFGVCWRDQYADKADRILAIPEIAEALSYRALVQIDQQDDGSIVVVPKQQTA